MSQVIRVSLPGYNALTDTDPDHFALYSDEDWILVKEIPISYLYTQKGVSLTVKSIAVSPGEYGQIQITPISYYPIAFVYYKNGNIWQPISGQIKQYNDSTSTDNQFNSPYINFTASYQEQIELNFINPTSSIVQFKFIIFFDLQRPI